VDNAEVVEVRALLARALERLEHDAEALDGLRNDRLHAVLQAMNTLRAELVAAIATLGLDA
jgi:hypothetical protein